MGPQVVRRGDRKGRRPKSMGSGTPGPTGPLQIVALPPCPVCGLPEGVHRLHFVDGQLAGVTCPEALPVDTGSPEDWVPSEGTLLRLLKRHYGWLQPEADQLVRSRP